MYLTKKNNVVTINRGDYFEQKIDLTIGSFPCQERWYLEYGDHALFHIMKPHQKFNDAIIKKDLTIDDCDSEGNLYVVIRPEETLELEPGTYYYEVKLVYVEESSEESVVKTDTIVHKTKFIILE